MKKKEHEATIRAKKKKKGTTTKKSCRMSKRGQFHNSFPNRDDLEAQTCLIRYRIFHILCLIR